MVYPDSGILFSTKKWHGGNLDAYYLVKEAIWKSYILYDSNYVTSWKRQNYGDSKKISGCQGLGDGRWTGEAQGIFRAIKMFCVILNSSVQSLSHVRLFATPWTAARQASLSITNSRSLPKLMSIKSVMPPNHLILCRPLLLLPPIHPSIRVFSNESTLRVRWPKYEFQLQHQYFQWTPRIDLL